MGKTKLLINNIFVYGLGGIVNKIIPFVMIPIITRIMPSTDYFGISDISNTIISFGDAFALLGMYDGLFRIYFEKEDEKYRKAACSTTLIFVVFTSCIVFLLMILFRGKIANIFFKNYEYDYIVMICATAVLVSTTNRIVSAPTRMQNKKKTYLIINTLSPIISYLFAIILLMLGYYTTALSLAAVVSGVIIEILYFLLNRKWFAIKLFDVIILKQLLVVALPLVPNFLIYWVFNSSDKIMITHFLGLGEEGIYSIGSKLGMCSQLIYMAFASGWSYFVFSTMKDDNQIEYNSKLFEIFSVVSMVATMAACAFSREFFRILFPGEYLLGYIIAPYLFLCPLIQMLFQIAASQFTIIKRTWYNMGILFGGAALNVVLNYMLIPLIGIEGAALATVSGYMFSLVVCIWILVRKRLFYISKNTVIGILMLCVFFAVWRVVASDSTVLSIFLALLFWTIMYILYRTEIRLIILKLRLRKNELKKIERE